VNCRHLPLSFLDAWSVICGMGGLGLERLALTKPHQDLRGTWVWLRQVEVIAFLGEKNETIYRSKTVLLKGET